MVEKLELTLFGAPELQIGGQPLPRFRSTKVYALLYYLAVTRRTQPRSVLAGLFWGDVGEYYARRNFNRTLSDLMQFVSDHLVVDRQSVAFARHQPYWLDVEVLENATAPQPTGQTLANLVAAANLYRGDFLDGFYVQEAPEFEQWVLTERTRLRANALQLLHTLAQYHTETGDLPQAMDYARRILQLEPWREEAHRQLMLLLAQSGQRSAALAQFELCRQALHSELAVEPDTATLDLVARIRTGTVDKETSRQAEKEIGEPRLSLSPPPLASLSPSPTADLPPAPQPALPPHNLPGQRTPFVGRAPELADLIRLLTEDDDCRLLSLIGPGGMGKTRLALKAAEQIVATPAHHARFQDGIFFVPLENVNQAEGLVSAVISAIAEESGFPLQMDAPLSEQLAHFLRTKAMLLVLDNFEHLVKEALLLSDLLVVAPRIKLLVTARETLGLQEAWFYPVVGLSLPTGLPEAAIRADEYDAVRLFVQCARRTRPDFAWEAEPRAVLHICTLVEGMPLGIELAATWLKVMNCTQIAQEITRGLDFLTARYHNLPPRHRSMRAVLDHSWALLTTEEGAALARLASFRGQFCQEAASAIAGASLLTLVTLVEKALVRVTSDSHYQLHELTRQYADEQLTSTARSALRDAHATYYANLLHQQKPLLFTSAFRQAWAAVGSELDNIHHAWQWLIQAVTAGRSDLPITRLLRQMAEVLAYYYHFHALELPGQALFASAGQAIEAAGWATQADSAAGPYSQQATWLHIRLLTGLFQFELGHYAASLAVAEAALTLCRTLNITEDLLLALLLYGRTQMRQGVVAAATASLTEALTLGQQLGSAHNCAEALFSLGMVASSGGRYAEAQANYNQALALCQEMGYRPWLARAYTNLGSTFSRQRAYQQALPYHEQALKIAQEEGNQRLIMISTSNLGSIQRGFGRYALSIAYYQQSLVMARTMGETRWLAANLNGIATTYLEMSDLAAAERTLREALTVGQQAASTRDLLGSIGLWGHLFAHRGQLDLALKALIFVEQHPATMAHDRHYNETLLSELRSELTPAFVAQVAAGATEQTLDDLVRWMLYGESKFTLSAPGAQ